MLGHYILFNSFDTGNETTGFRLPSFPDYDIPMMFADCCFDAQTGDLVFDTFNIDGILGDKFMVNGVVHPVLHVRPRRYRFRWTNSGPSRFLQLYLTDLNSPSDAAAVLANLERRQPAAPPGAGSGGGPGRGGARRRDHRLRPVRGKTIYIENRLNQPNGQVGPTGGVVAGGQGFLCLKIVVDLPSVTDNSAVPSTSTNYYTLPSVSASPRVTQLQARPGPQRPMDHQRQAVRLQYVAVRGPAKQPREMGLSRRRDWSHPMHVHLEEHQVIQGAPGLYGSDSDDHNDYSRWRDQYCWSSCSTNSSTGRFNLAAKDTVRLTPRSTVTIKMRFRDGLGRYPMHYVRTSPTRTTR